LEDEGKVVTTRVISAEERQALDLGDEWTEVVHHRRITRISYPFEWTFSMLRDAVLLQIEVTRRLISDGCLTKDATPYNVQFDGARPVFIDIGSFERLQAGEQWAGYRQFCELFLNPLIAQSVGGIPFQPWLRGSLEGIRPVEAAALLRGRKRLDRRLAVHVSLHARAEKRYADHDAEGARLDGEMKRAGFGLKVLDAQLDNLDKTVRSLHWDVDASTWSGYGQRSHYTDKDLAAKEAFVARTVADQDPTTVLDLGANDGRFSQPAVDSGARRAIAVDSDHLVMDRLYRRLRAEGEHRILPLVLDVADPSPGLGWRGRERPPFVDRVRPDLVLALAVVHDFALTNTVPFQHIVDGLADFGSPLVVEFPHRDDPMAARLLARKRAGLFDHYSRERWEIALGRRFDVVESETLPSGTRTLYGCTHR
jgi:ribosomal protein L11 methylase PrmA